MSFRHGSQKVNTRSRRQLETLRRARDWHLSMALSAKHQGQYAAYEFHMRYYALLRPAADVGDLT
jgi:hypothetical protein